MSVTQTRAPPTRSAILLLQHDFYDPPCFLLEYLNTVVCGSPSTTMSKNTTGGGSGGCSSSSATTPTPPLCGGSSIELVHLRLWKESDRAKLPHDVDAPLDMSLPTTTERSGGGGGEDEDENLARSNLDSTTTAAAVVGAEYQSKIVGIASCGGDLDAFDTAGNPYFLTVMSLFRSAIDKSVPVMGICLGAQLLAMSLGGTVAKLPEECYEVGWRDIDVVPLLLLGDDDCNKTEEDDRRSSNGSGGDTAKNNNNKKEEVKPIPSTIMTSPLKDWFGQVRKSENLFSTTPTGPGAEPVLGVVRFCHFHSDFFSLPEGCHLVASTKCCPTQAFQVGSSFSIGMQFHPEMDAAKATVWAGYGHDGFNIKGPGVVPQEVMLATAEAEAIKSKEAAKDIYKCWTRGLKLN